MTKKIRVLVPYFILEIIEHDIERFNIKKNRLANIIFRYFKDNYTMFLDNEDIKNNIIQFNFNKSNDEIYEALMDSFFNSKVDTEAKLFRSLFYTYISNPASVRERIIFEENYKKILTSIKNKVKVKIKYNNTYREIEPFFISDTKERLTNYLCGYSYKYNKVINYKLSKIEKIILLKSKQAENDKIDIIALKKSFDPYLSYNQKVKVKFTEKGMKLFENSVFKPKIISKEKNIYIIESSEYRAKEFLASFFEEVEILEPKTLRTWMIERVTKLSKLYL